jgi:hypothetical protein
VTESVVDHCDESDVFDDHEIAASLLARRYFSDTDVGLSTLQADVNRVTFGRNKLTPPPATSEWVSDAFAQSLVMNNEIFSLGSRCGSADK